MIIILDYKNITLSIILGTKASVGVCKTDRETNTDCHIDPLLLLRHSVSSSRPHFGLLLLSQGVLNQRRTVGPWPQQGPPVTCWYSLRLTKSLLTAS